MEKAVTENVVGGESAAAPVPWRRWLALLGWGVLLALAAWFIWRDALRYFGLDEEVFGRFWPRRWWLLAHAAGGMTALLSGPFQFWSGLRRSRPRAHRWLGRVYVGSVLTVGVTALYLAFFIPESDGGRAAGGALFTLAALWLAATGLALAAIRRRRVASHREWVVRSYVLTFAFVTLRWWPDLPLVSGLGTPRDRFVVVAWVGWILPLLAAEVLMRRGWRRPTYARGASGPSRLN